jgi:hypothetical protein
LYNLTADPGEEHDLGAISKYSSMVEAMTVKLKAQIDYPAVSLDVAQYSKAMFTQWYMNQSAPGTWRDWIIKGEKGSPAGVPGGPSGTSWPAESVKSGLAAIDTWLKADPAVLPCRGVDWTPPK